MKRSAVLTLLVFAVDVAAVAAAIALPRAGGDGRALSFVTLAGLAFAVGARPVRLPSLRTEFTAMLPFVFCALGLLGPFRAGLVALAGVCGAAIGRGHLPRPIHLAFNLGAVFLSSALAGWMFLACGGVPGDTIGGLVAPLWAAAVTFFAANTLLVASVVSLEKGEPFLPTWCGAFLWTPAAYLASLAIAVAMLAIVDSSELWAVVLGVPPCWLLVSFYRSHPAATGRSPALSPQLSQKPPQL